MLFRTSSCLIVLIKTGQFDLLHCWQKKNGFRLFFEDFFGFFEDHRSEEHIKFYPKVEISDCKRSDHILEYKFKFEFSLSQFVWIKNFGRQKADLIYLAEKNFFWLHPFSFYLGRF